MRSRGDFQRAYSRGNRAKDERLTVVVCANGLEHTRLGLSVGKRCWKSAVRRNRVRRVFRDAFRLALPELPHGLDVVLVASTPKLEPDTRDVLPALVRLVHKAHRRYLEKLTRVQESSG